MVDALIPQDVAGEVTAQAPRDPVSGFAYARKGSYLQRGLDQLSDGLEAAATPAAEAQARSDLANTTVTRDANGTPVVNSPQSMPIFGAAGNAYSHAMAAGQLALADNSVTADMNAARIKFAGDPDGFRNWSSSYAQSLKASNPGAAGMPMFESALRMGTQIADGMSLDKAKGDIDGARSNIVNAMSSREDQMLALVAQPGGDASPEFDRLSDEHDALKQSLVANPAFGVSQATADANDDALGMRLTAATLVGHVDRDMAGPTGDVGVTLKNLYDGVHDPSLSLTEAQRSQLYEQGLARVKVNISNFEVARKASEANFAALDGGIKDHSLDGRALTEPFWQTAIKQASSIPGNIETTQRLNALHQTWLRQQVTQGLSPLQSLNSQGLSSVPGSPGVIVPAFGGSTSAPASGAPQALLAVGTNDWQNADAAYGGVKASIAAAKAKGYDPVVVLPNQSVNGRGDAYQGALKAAQEAGAKTEYPAGWGLGADSIHMSPAAADIIKQAHPGAAVFGDSNAVRLGAQEGVTGFTGQGGNFIAGQIAAGSSAAPVVRPVAGPAEGANGLGTINAAYRAPLDAKGEKGIVSPAEHYAFLISQGATKNEALMLTGAAANESSFNATAVHDGGNGYGLYGHNLGRLDLRGQDWQQQATAALKELRTRPESAQVNAATTPDQLAVAEMNFENPRGYTSGNPKGGDNYTGRLNTIRYFAQMGDGVMAGSNGSPTMTAAGVPSANGTPYTDQQIKDNPFLLSSTVMSIAKDPANQLEQGRVLGENLLRTARMGQLAPVEAAAQFMQLSANRPELAGQREELSQYMEGKKAEEGAFINAPPGMSTKAYLDAAQRLANSSGSIHQMMVAQHAQEFYAKDVESLTKDPVGTAVAKGWAKQPAPLDFDNVDPNSSGNLYVALHQRADIAAAIAAHMHGPLTSVIPPDDMTQIKGAIAGGTAQQLSNITSAVNSLNQGRDQAVAEIGPTVAAAAKSGDPAKMKAAYGFMGQQYKNNPTTVEHIFGEQAVKEYMTYQRSLAFMPPDAAMKRVEMWNDPEKTAAREETKSAADEEIKGLTPDQVAAKFSSWSALNPLTWPGGQTAMTPSTGQAASSGAGLLAAYRDAYREQRALGDDKTAADKNALSLLQTRWTISGVNGNQLMRNAPETVYPQIDGSRNWIGEQLDKAIYQATGADKARPEATALNGEPTSAWQRKTLLFGGGSITSPDSPETMAAMRQYLAPRSLGSDQVTDADVAAGKPPSYFVAIKNRNGNYEALMDRDNPGKLLRFRPDPTLEPGYAAAHAPGFTTGSGQSQVVPNALRIQQMGGY